MGIAHLDIVFTSNFPNKKLILISLYKSWLIITDQINRTNQNIQANNIFVENQFITNFVLSNRREKADLIFSNNYELSVKTLIESNQEINLGSFEKTALFYLLDVEDYLGERKGKEIVLKNSQTVKVGLGSKILLKNLLLYLEETNKFNIFQERFINMAKNIFSGDFLIAIKNDIVMDLYFLPKEKFINLLEKVIITPDLFLTVINRWEGNSIRVNRQKILEVSNHIRLNFNFLEQSILKDLEEFENKISQLLIFYINEQDKEKYKNKMFQELDKIVKILDQNMEELN